MQRSAYLAVAITALAVFAGERSPAEAETIHACVRATGSLRIVASPADCRDLESPLSWNVQGPAGPAGPPGAPGSGAPNFQLVGISVRPLPGGAGIGELNRTCSERFPGSRMCTTLEVMNTPDPPLPLFTVGWVRPVFVGFDDAGNAIDASGRQGHPEEQLTCNVWAGGPGSTGTVVLGTSNANAYLGLQPCDVAHSTACCAPVSP
jgi:hypothetical protein